MSCLFGTDLSHHQDSIDWPALAAALRSPDGAGFVIHKASEGDSYVDPQFAPRRDAAHGVGLAFGGYHFARLGSVSAEVNRFLSVFGAPRPGELIALDLEVAVPGVDAVAWSGQWLDGVAQAVGFEPLIYLNRSELTGLAWGPVVARGAGLWLAAYDRSTAAVDPGAFSVLAVKQYTDAGQVGGLGSAVDLDVFYGDAGQLARYGFRGAPVPVAPPTPAPAPGPAPTPSGGLGFRVAYGQTSDAVRRLQVFLAGSFPAYAHECGALPATGFYGDVTTRWVADFAHRCRIFSADGRNVGPQIAAALAAHGFRG